MTHQWAMQEALRDVAISQPGFVVLSDASLEAIIQQLEHLRREVDAQYILLADMSAQRLAEVGVTTGLDTNTLLSLLSSDFATIGALACQACDGEVTQIIFRAGNRYEICATTVGDNLFLAMVYDLQIQASHIGIVWLHTRRAIKRLLSILSTTEAIVATQSPDAASRPCLTVELDMLLTDVGQCSSAEPATELLEGQTAARSVEGGRPDGDELERELLDLEAAIARELVSGDSEMRPPK